ncbi:hypothetical protein BP6252_10938 [Coleophoma cylindrospora]|uniref:Uncharacterized protein n=1 Tax=Coleophoma cylindrospora TaxID=1849047 RepID=A0A3D8QNJ4_9HELO|nr:hypothetical protein BP6252_10938 [Coleophoma cylindrospora]
MPHDLIREYDTTGAHLSGQTQANTQKRSQRTRRDIYQAPDDNTPLFADCDSDDLDGPIPILPYFMHDESSSTNERIVIIAIYMYLIMHLLVLIGKMKVFWTSRSLAVLASLVNAALNLVSSAIVWRTIRVVTQPDVYSYPIGRRKLEPIGVLIFSVIVATSFFQLNGTAYGTMSAIIIVQLICLMAYRSVKNTSVQALVQDVLRDVILSIFSVVFPFVGFHTNLWWLDSAGGLMLSVFVMLTWLRTTSEHVRNLSGQAATSDERSILLYLTMRFAKTIKQVQNLNAYHSGDKVIVEVVIVVDDNMSIRDGHDIAQSLQHVLESVPIVERAYVEQDYASWNLPNHLD